MKTLLKPTQYTFNKTARTVTFIGVSPTIEQILVITNIESNVMIYNFALTSVGGTLAGQVLTLDYNTTSMANTDHLQVWVDLDIAQVVDPVGSTTSTAIIDTHDTVQLLKRILKVLESNATVDSQQRQRITVDTATSGALSAAGWGVSMAGNIVTNAPPYTIGSLYPHHVWEGPVEQRWRVLEDARNNFGSSVRPQIVFS